MALLFSTAGPACFDRAWPEERLLTHLLRSAVTAAPEAFKSLHGDHPFDIYQSQTAYELRSDAPGLSQDDIIVEVHEDVLMVAASTPKYPSAAAPFAGNTSAPATAPSASPAPAADTAPNLSHSNGNGVAAASSPPSPTKPDSPSSASTSASWKVLRRERSPSAASWSRAFLLPETVNADGISVRLDKGVLTLHVPKCPPPPKTQPRRIAINNSS